MEHGRNGYDPLFEDPQPILDLLEVLKDDPDVRVPEQVATDTRDIVKDYPDAGYATLERWRQVEEVREIAALPPIQLSPDEIEYAISLFVI